MTLDIRGVNANFMDFQVSGLRAVGEALRSIATGRADACIAGGVATHVDPSQVREGIDSGYLARTRDLQDPPGTVVRPYDARRVGTILSEGAAFVCLEEEGHAARRGAGVLARVQGFGLGSDGATNFGVPHTSKGLAIALGLAAREAGVAPSGLGFIVGHGSGSLHADGAEAQVYAEALGDAKVPITSPKGALGDLCEAGGVLALILAVETLAGRDVPPTHNFKSGVDHAARLAISPDPQAWRQPSAVITARNFLGASCALVVGKA
jgi:3-oxoacyl-[acyl-carrier-protein] synthase II